MRILHLSTSFPSQKSDASGKFVQRLVEAEKGLNLECQVLTPSSISPSLWPDSFQVYRFRYAPWPWQVLSHQPGGIPQALSRNPILYVLLPPFFASMALNLVRLAKDCHVIHANWSICGVVAVLTRRFHKRPVITTVHGSDHHLSQKNNLYHWIHRKAIFGSIFVAGVSKSITNEMKSLYPARKDRIHFVPNGVSNLFYAVDPHKRPFVRPLKFLYVGSLIPLKGIDILIQAFANTGSHLSWSLTIAGAGSEMENLKQMANSLNLASRVYFMGKVEPELVPMLMSDHHIFVLPSYREGRPSVVLEAMAAGMPVIATDIKGTRELVQDMVTGWLFRPGDAEGLSKILSLILESKNNFMEMGLRARTWMQEHGLTWMDTAKAYRELYERAIKMVNSE